MVHLRYLVEVLIYIYIYYIYSIEFIQNAALSILIEPHPFSLILVK